MLEEINSVQGASQTDILTALQHASAMMRDQLKRFTEIADAMLEAAKEKVETSSQESWDGSNMLGTQDMRERIFETVKQRWLLERKITSAEEIRTSDGA